MVADPHERSCTSPVRPVGSCEGQAQRYGAHVKVELATSWAFVVVFGVAVVAFIALSVWVMIWAIRRDRAGRRVWLAERIESEESPGDDVSPV